VNKALNLVPIALLAACSQAESPVPEATETEVSAAAEPALDEAQDGSQFPPAEQVADIRLERVSFADAARSKSVEGSIQGYQSVDYVINVKTGQAMNISMATPNTAAYFNLIEPGETEVAIFVGSTSGNMYEGIAQKLGDYRVRVYMMRSAARREEKANYRLEFNLG